ncbi:PHP N-terminal domain protein [Psychrobacter sp. JCM 18903]|uniref:TrlF family AAA-like ATPase n=1 Tax=Psychrobacter sp. JCM 18903 TaxID=1298610 RepID=UPI00043079A3|nr:PHP-associated domain-containing protein [Psychrobacter sp. JCM 18903]GAF61860.1 PHP N-terminal domain protein [Psychrobacter sp. JCM 18903]
MDLVGARWWKFDIHTHTPASFDYGKGDSSQKNITARDWLINFVNKGIECIAVTDHNSGNWIDRLKVSAEELRQEGIEIHVFPGVEITANSNIHILGIFDPSCSSSKIDTIIARSRYEGERGNSNAVAQESAEKIIKEIKHAGGIAIPAHIDLKAGMCTQTSAHTIKQICEVANAVEIIYPDQDRDDAPLSRYKNTNINLPSVIGSDAHHPNDIDRAFTWFKMSTPSIEGLRLALIDGKSSILRSDSENQNPNQTSNTRLQSITVSNTKYAGRSSPLTISFSPWLNTLIGGRGSGKSSVLEFIRLGMDRARDVQNLDANNEVRRTFENFIKTSKSKDSEGALLENTQIECLYHKDSALYSLEWSMVDPTVSIKKKVGDNWIEEDGEAYSRFPVKIFSQKQVYDFAKNPNALLNLIDQSSSVQYQQWNMRWKDEINRYYSLCAQKRELELQVSNKPILVGQLADIDQKISVIESSGHQDVLTQYQFYEGRNRLILEYEEAITTYTQLLTNLIDTKSPRIDLNEFSSTVENDISDRLKILSDHLEVFKQNILDNIFRLEEQLYTFNKSYHQSDFKDKHSSAVVLQEKLSSSLAEEGIGNPNQYADLISTKLSLERNINELTKIEIQIQEVDSDINSSYRTIVDIRIELTKNRIAFLNRYLSNNDVIKIEILPLCDKYHLESTFRELIGKNDNTFVSDIYDYDKKSGLLYELNQKLETTAKSSLEDTFSALSSLKLSLSAQSPNEVSNLNLSKRFKDLLDNLNPNIQDAIQTWFPEDNLTVKFNDGKKFKDVSQGSAGQKASAILSFLLSYGSEPLILDQPEDDLDNGLISSLIVSKLHESKKERQIIIVTHNPNIVVNGDSEYVIALEEKGQININASGALQEINVRKNVCEIMEGGEIALQKRYNRMFNI